MGLLRWLRRSRARRIQLDRADLEVAHTLASLAAVAPAVAETLRASQGSIKAQGHAAVTTQRRAALDGTRLAITAGSASRKPAIDSAEQ
jgi:hypothetical protein